MVLLDTLGVLTPVSGWHRHVFTVLYERLDHEFQYEIEPMLDNGFSFHTKLTTLPSSILLTHSSLG